MGKKLKKLSFEEYGHKLDLDILLPINRYRATADAKEYFVKLWPKVRQQTIRVSSSMYQITQQI